MYLPTINHVSLIRLIVTSETVSASLRNLSIHHPDRLRDSDMAYRLLNRIIKRH